MMKKILLTLLAILVVAALYLNYGKQPSAIPADTQSFALLEGGPYGVRSTNLTLTDKSRGIDANGDYQGHAEREFTLYLWTPASKPDNPQPLMIYSHGFMSNGKGGNYLARHLASLGYTVAAATYPLTHYGAPGGPNPADVVNQPDDISFIIDTLLHKNADPDSDLYQRIDASRIAAVGLSLGGMTTELAAFHPLTAEQRIVAAVSIAGPANMFSKRFFSGRRIPFMMVASPLDALVTYAENAADILDKVSGATLVSIDDASHTGFAGPASWLRWMDNPDSLGCDAVLKNADMEDEQSWYESLGGAEVGVLPAENTEMCTMDPLPVTMNPLRQHQLNTLAVSSFLQCHLASERSVADQNCRFLHEVFALEFSEVSVQH